MRRKEEKKNEKEESGPECYSHARYRVNREMNK